jgi:hypothetical protein
MVLLMTKRILIYPEWEVINGDVVADRANIDESGQMKSAEFERASDRFNFIKTPREA